MQNELQALLKPDAVKKFQGKTPSEMLQAPVTVLKFLTAAQVKSLKSQKINTLSDLIKLSESDRVVGSQINPALLEQLICLLSYPQYDPGPNCPWERLFQSAPLNNYVNFPGSPFHTRFGPVFYRGRLNGTARVLVIGQDPATDETLAQRVFVGQAGQIAQNFLTRLGLTRSYLMFNTYLFGAQSGSISNATATDASIMTYRNKLFDRAKATNTLSAVIAFGSHANTAATNWPGLGSIPLIHLMHPTAPSVSDIATNWNSHFAAAHAAVAPDPDGTADATPYSTSASAMPATDIPRRDLPFGIPAFHGTGGATRSQRVSGNFETQITWTAP